MLEKLLELEREAFLTLNSLHSDYWDRFMWLYSGKFVWLPLAAFIIFILVYKKDWRESVLVLLGIGLVVLFCDQFTSGLIKPLFMRFRPTHHPDFMNEVVTVFGYRGGLYGFISGHAANAFGFAIFMSLLFRYKLFTWVIFIWAFVMAYSRIYLGVHFLTDIIPGALSGLVLGWLAYFIYSKGRVFVLKKSGREVIPSSEIYTKTQKQFILYGIALTVAIQLSFNTLLVSFLLR